MLELPRRFYLLRHHDVSGVSGIGIVADGVVWPDETVSIRWRGERPSTVHWDRVADAAHVHGHQGSTEFVWVDAASEEQSIELPAQRADDEVLRIVQAYVIESNDSGGIDANDLVSRLERAGYPLPDDEDGS